MSMESIKSIYSCVSSLFNRCCSHLRLGFFGLGVPAVEDFNKRWDDLRATGSLESNDSGVSLKSDQSKGGLIDFKDRVSPRPDFSSSEEEDVSDDEDLVESPDDQRATRSLESIIFSDFRVPFGIQRCYWLPSCRQRNFYLSEKEHDVSDDKDLVKSPDVVRAERRAQLRKKIMAMRRPESPDSDVSSKSDQSKYVFPRRATGSLESNDSDVSLKSDQSKGGLIDFKDRVSPRPDFSSSEEEDVSDDEDLVESPDDQGGDERGAVV